MDNLMTVIDFAHMSGVTERTVRRWITAGQVRTVGHGRDRRVVSVMSDSPSKTADSPDADGQDGCPASGPDQDTPDAPADIGQHGRTSGHPDMESVHLAALVSALTDRLAEQSALTAMWMERCRVLAERPALIPPETLPERNLTRLPPWVALGVVPAVVVLLLAAGVLLAR